MLCVLCMYAVWNWGKIVPMFGITSNHFREDIISIDSYLSKMLVILYMILESHWDGIQCIYVIGRIWIELWDKYLVKWYQQPVIGVLIGKYSEKMWNSDTWWLSGWLSWKRTTLCNVRQEGAVFVCVILSVCRWWRNYIRDYWWNSWINNNHCLVCTYIKHTGSVECRRNQK